jgi:hypothetical protein
MTKMTNVRRDKKKMGEKKLPEGIYRAVVTECDYRSRAENYCEDLHWTVSLRTKGKTIGSHGWVNELVSMEQFEDIQRHFAALGLRLRHLDELAPLAALAVGRRVYVEVQHQRGQESVRLLCPDAGEAEPLPFWERMTFTQAHTLMHERGIAFYADTLDEHAYLREPGDDAETMPEAPTRKRPRNGKTAR